MADDDDAEYQEVINSALSDIPSNETSLSPIIIQELRGTRNAYNQSLASQSKAILKALFELPFVHAGGPMTLPDYFGRLNKLLDMYRQLFREEQQPLQTKAVVDALIQALRSGRITGLEGCPRDTIRMLLNSEEGQTSLCVLAWWLVHTRQDHLATTLADDMRVVWIQRDYGIAYVTGISSTQLREYLDGLENIWLLYVPDGTVPSSTPDGTVPSSTPDGTVPSSTPDGTVLSSTPDGTVPSSMQDVIRNAWRTAKMTNDHVTTLVCKAFPTTFNASSVFIATDNHGAECYWYLNIERQGGTSELELCADIVH